jgi:hypothetical protein
MNASFTWTRLVCACAAVLLIPSLTLSAVPKAARKGAPQKEAAEQVELFAAMKSGDIDVQLIPRDETEVRLMIKNKTKKPLSVKLPEAFAGVPVLAQIGNNRSSRSSNSSSNSNNANQGLGGGMMGGGMMGGMGGMGGGMGGMGGGGGFFNVPAEKVGQMKIATVCLEHGKKIPNPKIPYEIKPIAEFNEKPEVRELLKLFSAGKLSQRAAQAAAWHFANDMTWEELAAKRIHHLNGTSEPYFSMQEIQLARQIAMATEKAVKESEKPAPSSSSTASLSQSR